MNALCAAVPSLARCKRTITRAPDAGGEVFDVVSETEFAERQLAGHFALWWRAHGLHYGIPASVEGDIQAGRTVLANLSRGALAEAATLFERFDVLSITASPEVLRRRLATRGRESMQDQAQRIARASLALPDTLPPTVVVHTIDNSGALSDAVDRALKALRLARVVDELPHVLTR